MFKKAKLYNYALVLIFLICLGFRLFFAFQSANLTGEESYFVMRQVENIGSELLPTYMDDLSFSGRLHIFPPLFYYILTPFSFLVGSVFALKLIPNILASLLVFAVYLLVRSIVKNKNIALFAALLSAFIPIFLLETVNSASIISLLLPLFVYEIYCFTRIDEKKYLYQFVVILFVLPLVSSFCLLFVFGLLIYLILAKLEYKKQRKAELEIILFSVFYTVWAEVLIFKKAFLVHSYGVVWQNIPSQILVNYFKDVDVLQSITLIGVIPLFLGIFAIYNFMFKEKNRQTYLLMAFAISVAILLWFKLITFNTGLVFLAVLLIILCSQALKAFFNYLAKSKIAGYNKIFAFILIVVFVLTSVIPSVVFSKDAIGNSVTQPEVEALKWMLENTPKDSVVLSTIGEGNLISAIAKRKNVADSRFLLVKFPDQIFDDVKLMYTSFFKTAAVEMLKKYDVDYIYFTPNAKKKFGIKKLDYIDEECFDLIYFKDNIKIYNTLCSIRETDRFGGSR